METAEAPHAVKGRPREFCVDAALAAALRVFWQRGYEGASMAELTEAMGITKPSLYAAFGNKEALFRKALDLYEQEKLSYMRTALEAPTSREVVQRLLMGAVDMQTSGCDPKGCLGVISTVACSADGESVREDVIARQASAHQSVVERFEKAKAEGDLPESAEPEALARYVKALLQGLSVQAGAGASKEDLQSLVATALSVWPGR